MSDNDSLIDRFQKKMESNAAERNLITLERSQKLDLLIHLLANLRKVLIVCGPNGIGKTTLLQSLQTSRKDQWDIYCIVGSSSFSYESIVIDLCRFLNLSDTHYSFDMAALRKYCEHQKVVLVVDDAGHLAPGLIDSLVSLSESLAGFRLVFAMTFDEFHIKIVTDKALEDSHSIELPALTQKQCSEYVQNLSAQPDTHLTFNEVTDSLIADLYRETHGIPGRILAEIPKLNQYQKRSKSRVGLWIGITMIVLIAGWFMKTLLPSSNDIFSKSPEQTVKSISLPADVEPNIIAVTKSMPSTQSTELPATSDQSPVLPIKSVEDKTSITLVPAAPSTPANSSQSVPEKTAASNEPISAKPVVSELDATPTSRKAVESVAKPSMPVEISLPPTPVPVEPLKKTPELKIEKANGADDHLNWILAQPAENYTLQVMVLSSKPAALRFLKKYPEYRDTLKYYVINKYGQEKFVLIYGSFSSNVEAKNSKAELPAEFKNSLEKRFKTIQIESRR